MTVDAEDRMTARFDRMEDMQRIGSERASAMVNEIGVLKSDVRRLLKVIDGNGVPPLREILLEQGNRLQSVEDQQKEAKGWKKQIISTAAGAVIVLTVGLLWSKAVAPVNQAAAVKSADDRIDVLETRSVVIEKQNRQILEILQKKVKPSQVDSSDTDDVVPPSSRRSPQQQQPPPPGSPPGQSYYRDGQVITADRPPS